MKWWCTRIFPSATSQQNDWLMDFASHYSISVPWEHSRSWSHCWNTSIYSLSSHTLKPTTAKCKVQLCNFGHKKSQTCRSLVLDGCISSSLLLIQSHSLRALSPNQVNHVAATKWPGRRLGPLPLDWVEELERPGGTCWLQSYRTKKSHMGMKLQT